MTQILAAGWPLALAGFAVGVFANEFSLRYRKNTGAVLAARSPNGKALQAIQSEIDAAKELLAKEADDDAAGEETFEHLNEAVKRANGRLKLIMKTIYRSE